MFDLVFGFFMMLFTTAALLAVVQAPYGTSALTKRWFFWRMSLTVLTPFHFAAMFLCTCATWLIHAFELYFDFLGSRYAMLWDHLDARHGDLVANNAKRPMIFWIPGVLRCTKCTHLAGARLPTGLDLPSVCRECAMKIATTEQDEPAN